MKFDTRWGAQIMIFGVFLLSYSCINTENQLNRERKKNSNDSLQKLAYKRVADSIHAEEKSAQLKAMVDSMYAFKNLNGCILIHQAGINLIQHCKGSTCLTCTEKRDNSSKTLFQLASMSKTFTAIATLQLVDKKVLNLSDSIEKFYPNFPFKAITIQSLLSHRSGLPNYMYVFNDSMFKAAAPNNQKLIQWFENEKPNPYGPANKYFSYNNSNYAVLAAIIEKASGLSFPEYMHQKIFKPLEMNHTYLVGEIPDTLETTIGHEGRNKLPKDFFDDIHGDKGIYSCIEDLTKWYNALQSNCLVSQEIIKMAFSPQSFEHRGVRNYGLGFRILLEKDQKTTKYIYHNGWWKGYSTLFWFSPKTKSFIVVLSNVKNKGIYKISPFIKVLEPKSELENDENED